MFVHYQLFFSFFKQEQEKTIIVELLLQVKDEQEAREVKLNFNFFEIWNQRNKSAYNSW